MGRIHSFLLLAATVALAESHLINLGKTTVFETKEKTMEEYCLPKRQFWDLPSSWESIQCNVTSNSPLTFQHFSYHPICEYVKLPFLCSCYRGDRICQLPNESGDDTRPSFSLNPYQNPCFSLNLPIHDSEFSITCRPVASTNNIVIFSGSIALILISSWLSKFWLFHYAFVFAFGVVAGGFFALYWVLSQFNKNAGKLVYLAPLGMMGSLFSSGAPLLTIILLYFDWMWNFTFPLFSSGFIFHAGKSIFLFFGTLAVLWLKYIGGIADEQCEECHEYPAQYRSKALPSIAGGREKMCEACFFDYRDRFNGDNWKVETIRNWKPALFRILLLAAGLAFMYASCSNMALVLAFPPICILWSMLKAFGNYLWDRKNYKDPAFFRTLLTVEEHAELVEQETANSLNGLRDYCSANKEAVLEKLVHKPELRQRLGKFINGHEHTFKDEYPVEEPKATRGFFSRVFRTAKILLLCVLVTGGAAVAGVALGVDMGDFL